MDPSQVDVCLVSIKSDANAVPYRRIQHRPERTALGLSEAIQGLRGNQLFYRRLHFKESHPNVDRISLKGSNLSDLA